jgi:hypothetical protein
MVKKGSSPYGGSASTKSELEIRKELVDFREKTQTVRKK